MRKRGVVHPWKVTPSEAVEIQKRLARGVVIKRLGGHARYVAGVDCAFSLDGGYCIGAAVMWDNERRKIIERRHAMRKVFFPYVPGLLSFREAPSVVAALKKLSITPDLLMCDGQGIAHPRRIGIAAHVGLLTAIPSVGCAKSRLIGEYREPGNERGAFSWLEDKGETLGVVLRTRSGVKPVFVSVGHMTDLQSATEIVLDCAEKYRLPEPIRGADRLAGEIKRSFGGV